MERMQICELIKLRESNKITAVFAEFVNGEWQVVCRKRGGGLVIMIDSAHKRIRRTKTFPTLLAIVKRMGIDAPTSIRLDKPSVAMEA
jgi:hypothetical protein